MTFEQALTLYLDHLRIERSLSPNTITAYQRDLRSFADLAGFSELSSVTEDSIIEYSAQLRSRGIAQSSINRSLSSLRSFFAYVGREFDLEDPTRAIEHSKVPGRLPKALTISEISALINASWSESEPLTLRDRAMIELLYGTGARVSELIGINVNDISTTKIDGEEVTLLKLRGKGSKERVVPIGSFASKAVEDYLVRIRPGLLAKSKTASNALFLNQRGARISRQSAWSMVVRASEKAALTGKVSPHVFRHSYATHLLDGGADIRVVQELLGHASVNTTQIYTLITIDKVRESYLTAHPRSM